MGVTVVIDIDLMIDVDLDRCDNRSSQNQDLRRIDLAWTVTAAGDSDRFSLAGAPERSGRDGGAALLRM